jgi:hypothetical protein
MFLGMCTEDEYPQVRGSWRGLLCSSIVEYR